MAAINGTEALKQPWILGTDWTVETADSILAAMDKTAAVVPGNYTSAAAWTAKVEELAGKVPKEEDKPDSEEEEGF